MRILRLSGTVEVGFTGGEPISIADDRWLAARNGRDLAIHDLAHPEEAPAVFHGVANFALQPGCLITSDADGFLHRWEPGADGWRAVGLLGRPDVQGAESKRWSRLLLSRSGRFLLSESTPMPTGPNTWPAEALLIDATRGKVLRSFRLSKAYASFDAMPNGDEVMFITADSYMSVQMVDCASGATLHEYVFQKLSDFCHTEYALTADGARLVTFGCIWAAPFEPIIYDVTPWTRHAPAKEGFPLPIVYSQVEAGYGDSALVIAVTKTRDGNLTGLTWVTMKYLPDPGGEDDLLIRKDMKKADEEIYDYLRSMPPCESAIIVRRINPANGEVAAWTVSAVPPTDEQHIHTLTDHRVLLVNDRVQLLNGYTGDVLDLGELGEVADRRGMRTAATSDGEHLVIWSPDPSSL